MKKTLITLAALAAAFSGVAAADDYTLTIPTGGDFYAGDYTFTFSVSDSMVTGEKYAIAAYFGTDANNNGGLGANGFNLTRTSDVSADGTAAYTFIGGTGWCNTAATDRVFTAISSDAGRYGSLNVTLGADTVYTVSVVGETGKQTVSLLDGETVLGTFSYNGNMYGGNADSTMGTYFNQDFKAVPEPATATLSLLALAGLAARRRRK